MTSSGCSSSAGAKIWQTIEAHPEGLVQQGASERRAKAVAGTHAEGEASWIVSTGDVEPIGR
jgi:hypothetical protein